MKLSLRKTVIATLAAVLVSHSLGAQDNIKNDEFNPITTGVTSLSIAPDLTLRW